MKIVTSKSQEPPNPSPTPNPTPTALRALPEFLSRREVASRFGVSLSTVTRWARTGQISSMRTPGGHYRYLADDVRRAIESSTRQRFA